MSADQPGPEDALDEETARTSLVITIDMARTRAVICAHGQLDAAGGDLLCRAVKDLAAVMRHVELNFSGITAADMAGVRAVEAARAAAGATGCDLTIQPVDHAAYPIDWHSVPHSSHSNTAR